MFINRKDFKGGDKPEKKEELTPSSASLLEPKSIEINGCKFIISKMPCTVAQEVIVKLPVGLVPILSNFSQAEEMAFKMLSYCERVYTDSGAGVKSGGMTPARNTTAGEAGVKGQALSLTRNTTAAGAQGVPLISKEIINNHVPDFQTLIKLEQECLAYNYDFFDTGKLLDFLNKGASLAESKISGILTDLLDKLFQAAEQHSTN